MNKRIKRKVTKRVLNKINNDESLTKFEKRFFMKYLFPTLKETVIAVRKAIEKVLPTVIKIATEKVNELSSAMAEAEQANIESTKKLESVNKELYIYTDNEPAKTKVTSGMQLVPENTKEPESYFKQIVTLNDEAYKVESSKWLGGIDIGSAGKDLSIVNQAYLNKNSKQFQHSFSDVTDERINAGLINAETIDITNFNFSTPENHHEIKSSVKETKWQKAKGKVKGWFGK